MEHRVYVPAPDHRAALIIHPGSGIVGRPQGAGVMVDYEGNLNGAGNIITLADRVNHAAGRQRESYPTVARTLLAPEALVAVGWYDDVSGDLTPDDADGVAALAAWLGLEALPESELRTTGASHERRRELLSAAGSPDPGLRQFARREAARLGVAID